MAVASVSAQVDSTTVVNATNTGLGLLWDSFSNLLSSNAWSVVALISTVLFAISEKYSFTKNPAVNGVIQAVLSFLASKKK